MRYFRLALTAIALWPAVTFAQSPQSVAVQPQILEIEAVFGDCPVSSDSAGRPVTRSCLDDLYRIARDEVGRTAIQAGSAARPDLAHQDFLSAVIGGQKSVISNQ